MERLAFETGRAAPAEPGSRTLRNILIVNALVVAAALALTAAAVRSSPSAGPGASPARDAEPRPLAGRRY